MREEREVEGWRRGKVMLLTPQFETTFFFILEEKAFATFLYAILKLDTKKQLLHFKMGRG